MTSPLLLPLAVFGLGTTELVLIIFAILLIFGGAKLPSLARGLGQSIREFKKASNDDEEAKAEAKSDTTTTPDIHKTPSK